MLYTWVPFRAGQVVKNVPMFADCFIPTCARMDLNIFPNVGYDDLVGLLFHS